MPYVLDRFGDDDTRQFAAAGATVASGASGPFSATGLLRAAATVAPPPMPLIYGSGFDGSTSLLARLAAGRELLGNRPGTISQVKDPLGFATTCRRLGIPHPEVSAEPPIDPRGWLVKRSGGAGGGHVRDATDQPRISTDDYFQRRVDGRAVSALLLGDGRRAMVLALSRQWQRPEGRRHYAGTLYPAALPEAQVERLHEASIAMAEAYRLRGLGSADFLVGDNGDFHLLEVNPRPGASLEAAEMHLRTALLGLHVAAVRGRLPTAPPASGPGAVATEIVWTDRELTFPHHFPWPQWAGDRTPAGLVLSRDDPVATIRAKGDDHDAVLRLLAERRALLHRLLAKGALRA